MTRRLFMAYRKNKNVDNRAYKFNIKREGYKAVLAM